MPSLLLRKPFRLALSKPCHPSPMGVTPLRRFCAAAGAKQADDHKKTVFRDPSMEENVVPVPSRKQLRRLFVQSAVPFVAFGIVDQSVLIYMGDFIDNSVCVTFALPTLAAAAMGQIFSDTAGVLFGGTIEAAALKLGLPTPGLSEEQNKLGIVRRISILGGVIGVITGCLLGMINLLFIDFAAAERAKKAKELEIIMKTVMEDGRNVVSCERATLWAVDEKANMLWSSVAHGVKGELRVPLDGDSMAALSAKNKEWLNIPDVTKDPRCKCSGVQGFTTRNMLVAPVLVEDECVAVIQLMNKVDEDTGEVDTFCRKDEKMLKLLASHTAIFISQLGS